MQNKFIVLDTDSDIIGENSNLETLLESAKKDSLRNQETLYVYELKLVLCPPVPKDIRVMTLEHFEEFEKQNNQG